MNSFIISKENDLSEGTALKNKSAVIVSGRKVAIRVDLSHERVGSDSLMNLITFFQTHI